MLMFNSILRYFMMTFFSVAIGCCIQLKIISRDPTNIDKVESILSMCILSIFLLMTGLLTRHVIKNQANLNKPQFKQAYGTLYTPCETRKGKWPLIYIAIFCLRRLCLAFVVSFLGDCPLLQIYITGLLSTFVLVWHLKVWPMENTRQNVLYLVNEYLYLGCCFYTLAFSEYNPDPQTRFTYGWFYMSLLGLILVANVVVMILDIILSFIACCR
jgi:hypothetical protein